MTLTKGESSLPQVQQLVGDSITNSVRELKSRTFQNHMYFQYSSLQNDTVGKVDIETLSFTCISNTHKRNKVKDFGDKVQKFDKGLVNFNIYLPIDFSTPKSTDDIITKRNNMQGSYLHSSVFILNYYVLNKKGRYFN